MITKHNILVCEETNVSADESSIQSQFILIKQKILPHAAACGNCKSLQLWQLSMYLYVIT